MVASLLISCKKKGNKIPPAIDYVNIIDKTYSMKGLFDMEYYILKTINFEFFTTISIEFYNILSKAFNFDIKQNFYGEYIINSSLLCYEILKYKKSRVGAACTYTVMKIFGIDKYRDLYSQRIVYE